MQFHTHPPRTSGTDHSDSASSPPTDLLRRINDLRERFVEADDFSVPFDYFDTHVACSPALFDYSDPKANAQILAAIEVCAGQVMPGFELRQRLIFEVANTDFWHGMGHGQREQLFFYYFDGIRMGLIGLSDPFDPRGVMHYLRFSAFVPQGPVMPSPVKRGQA